MTNDPRETWQLQPSEEYKISLETLRLRSRQLAVRARFQFFGISGFVLALILFDVWSFQVNPYPLQRAGFLVAAGWALSALIKAGQRIWPSRLSQDAGWMTCLAFSRHQLQRQLNYFRHIWSGVAGAALATLVTMVAPGLVQIYKTPRDFAKVLPVLVLLVIWLVTFVIMSRQQRQKLRHELDELGSLGSEPSQTR